MPYILKQVGSIPNIPINYFECDNESDLTDIKASDLKMGDRCYVINSGITYALNSQKQWKKVPTSSSSGSGSGEIYDGGEEV